jgi:hypothetical protein
MKRILLVAMLVTCSFAAVAFAQAAVPIEETVLGMWIKAHAPLAGSILLAAGAITHYLKKHWRGETTSDIVSYFTADHPAHSAGLGAALLAAIAALWTTDVLAGATATLIVLSTWGIGFALDSGVNKAAG